MEWIRISENKIKVMLSPEDVAHYALPTVPTEGAKGLARTAFRAILSDMREAAQFDAGEDKVYVQLYPSSEGGFELFITKMGVSLHEEPHALHLTYQKEEERRVALLFPTLSALIAVCRRLCARGFVGESCSFLDDTRRYWLFLSEKAPQARTREDYRFALEYGEIEAADTASLLLAEHGRCICEQHAVEQIGKL